MAVRYRVPGRGLPSGLARCVKSNRGRAWKSVCGGCLTWHYQYSRQATGAEMPEWVQSWPGVVAEWDTFPNA